VTATPPSPTLATPDVEAVVRAVRACGRRVTAARRDLIETLFAADGPVSAEQIASGLDGARTPVDDASVYANLETLEDLGLVRHVHLGHGPGLWTLADRARREFLHCERCGAWQAVEPSVLADARAAIRRATGYEAQFTHFPICGRCADCARAEAGPET
jgi:Fe2+ or Zn2+ uptake regulation protein